MNFLKKIISVIIFAFISNNIQADELSDSVADAFGFPRLKLHSKDLIATARLDGRKSDASLKAAYLIESDDHTFAFIRLLVVEKGLLLTPEIEKRLQDALVDVEKLGPNQRDILQIDLPNIGKVYSAPAGMGPGGSTHRALIRLEAQKIDVALDQTVDFDEPLDFTDETKTYYNALREDPTFTARTLGKALETISRDIVAGKYSFAKAVDLPVKTPTAEPPSIQPPVPAPQPQSANTPSSPIKAGPEVPPHPTVQENAGAKNLWALLLVLLAVIIALVRRKKSK